MIPEGNHKARGVEAALGKAGTGTTQVAVLLRITEGEHEGVELTWYGFFTEKTEQRTIESLIRLGWQGDDLSDLRGIDSEEVTIVVEHEADQHGEVRARVRWINGPGGLAMKDRMDPASATAFATRMRGKVIAMRRGGGAQNGAQRSQGRGYPSSHAGGSGTHDDDIPF